MRHYYIATNEKGPQQGHENRQATPRKATGRHRRAAGRQAGKQAERQAGKQAGTAGQPTEARTRDATSALTKPRPAKHMQQRKNTLCRGGGTRCAKLHMPDEAEGKPARKSRVTGQRQAKWPLSKVGPRRFQLPRQAVKATSSSPPRLQLSKTETVPSSLPNSAASRSAQAGAAPELPGDL